MQQPSRRTDIKSSHKHKITLFSHVYLFVFKNDYEISGDTVFLSFILKNLILIIKHNRKVNFHLFNRIISIPFISSAKFKTCFSWKENFKKCTGFEEQKAARYFRENVYFGIIVFSCLSPTKPCHKFLLICFAWEIKHFYEIS